MRTASSQVLIVGGGPAGLAAAVELGRRGIRVCLVEPRDSYEPERRPVAAQTIADSTTQEKLLAQSFASLLASGDGQVAEALQVKSGEFHSEGLVLGYH
jgi:heterodisulfide reductase subunit A-like polyferredoxin